MELLWNCIFYVSFYKMSVDAYTCFAAGKNALFLIFAPLINFCHGCQRRRKNISRADCRSSLKPVCCTKPKTTQASVSGLPKYISHTDVFLSPGPRSYRNVLWGPYWKALMCSCLSSCPASCGVLLLPSPLFEENTLWLPAADTHRQLLVASCWKSLPLFLGQRNKRQSVVWRAQLKVQPARFLGSSVTGHKSCHGCTGTQWSACSKWELSATLKTN